MQRVHGKFSRTTRHQMSSQVPTFATRSKNREERLLAGGFEERSRTERPCGAPPDPTRRGNTRRVVKLSDLVGTCPCSDGAIRRTAENRPLLVTRVGAPGQGRGRGTVLCVVKDPAPTNQRDCPSMAGPSTTASMSRFTGLSPCTMEIQLACTTP